MPNKSSKKTKNSKNAALSSKNVRSFAPVKENEKEKLTGKQKKILIFVLIASIIICSGMILTVVLVKGRGEVNFLKDDLTKYITLSKEDYKNIDLNIPLEDTSDEAVNSAVESEINMLLTEHKTLNTTYNGLYVPMRELALGDTVDIYYRGYTVDENGRQQDFDGSSNIAGSLTTLEVGTGKTINSETLEATGSFIPGFGESLVGKIPGNYSRIDKRRNGAVMEGDVIYVSYSVMGEDGNEEVQNRRIDLSLSYIDEVYGEGFKAYFIGKNIGEDLPALTLRKSGHSTDTVYYDIKVSFVTRGTENNPITIKVTFPANYSEESLRGVETYFDVFVDSACAYDVPAYDDAFVTEKLKVRADTLSSYEGATLAEKYRSKLRADKKQELEDSNFQLLSDKVWDHLMSKVVVNKLPAKTLNAYYDSYYSTIRSLYMSGYYSQSYSDIGSLAIAYLNETYGMGLSSGADWKAAITQLAEWNLTKNIVFYYIIREENMLPNEQEYKVTYDILYNDMLEYYIEANADKLSSLDDESYQKEIEVLKSEINSAYDDEYFKEEVYRYFGTQKIIAMNTK